MKNLRVVLTTLIIPTEPFDCVEVHPCQIIEKGKNGKKDIVEQCEPKDADFWSVYVHLKRGGLECIADCVTKKEAETFEKFVNSIIEHYDTPEYHM